VRSAEILRVREFGVQHNLPPLVNAKWPAHELDGWEMAAVSARLLDAEAAYRCPYEQGFLFLLLNGLRRVADVGK
jgi:hypothetical protein